MKKRNVVIVTIVGLFLATGFTACKHNAHLGGFDRFDMEAITNRIAAKLDLTESQKADLEEMVAAFAEKAKAMHADHESRHAEMAELIRQETINQEMVDQMIAEKFDRMKEMTNFAVAQLIDFHATLTPEQREKIAQHMEEHASRKCRFFRDEQ
jgi:Spy/CpxP family protein refolding chaperone